jgi:hypothetical protein
MFFFRQVDFDELDQKLNKVENDCRAAFDSLRAISKHETPQVKTKYVYLNNFSIHHNSFLKNPIVRKKHFQN